MNWEAIGAIGEVVGAIAVVATLAYLAVQLRQNTQSSRNASWQAIIGMLVDLDVTEATDPQLSSFIQKAEDAPESLTDEQYWKFKRIAQARLGALEYAFLASRSGTIDEYLLGAIQGYTELTMSKPGYRKFWSEVGEAVYHPDFIAHVNLTTEKTDGGS